MTEEVVDNFVIAFLFHLHRALVDESLLDVDAEAVLIHVASVKAVFYTKFVGACLNRLNALFKTNATAESRSRTQILSVVNEHAFECGERSLSLESNQTAVGVHLNRLFEKVAARRITLCIKSFQFKSVGICTCFAESITGTAV